MKHFAVQATNNSTADDIREEMAQMRTNLGLVFKNVSGGAKKMNVMNYLTKPPPPAYEYYYDDDVYELMIIREVSDQTPKVPIKIIIANVKETKNETMVITITRVNMSKMGITIAKATLTRITIVIGINEVDHIFQLKIRKLPLGTMELV